MRTPPGAAVDLYWIPLGAGGHSVRFNGRVFEAMAAWRQHRGRYDLYHAALVVECDGDTYAIEVAPSPDADEASRGVVAMGAVGSRHAGRWRLFRYEVRCWRGGSIPDLGEAVGGAQRLSGLVDRARRAAGRRCPDAAPSPRTRLGRGARGGAPGASDQTTAGAAGSHSTGSAAGTGGSASLPDRG